MAPFALALLALALVPRSAHAELAAGDVCTLSTPLVVKLRTSTLSAVPGTVEAELAAESEILITEPGPRASRIRQGEVEALVPTEALEAACALADERCVLEAPIKMAASLADGKQKVFRVKTGATLSIVERGPSRTRVLVDDVQGRVNTAHLDEKCRPLAAGTSPRGSSAGASSPAVKPAPEGTRAAVLPFAIAPEASAIDARALEDALSAALLERRADVMGLREPRPSAEARRVDAKVHLYEAASLGARMGVPFVITGHLAREGEGRLLSLSVYDVKKGRLVRTVRVRPTDHPKDPWASVASAHLDKVLPGAS